ncbi:MAG: glutamate-5-semialdehyde dehydrogenase [Gammaproteobacteria bacterium]
MASLPAKNINPARTARNMASAAKAAASRMAQTPAREKNAALRRFSEYLGGNAAKIFTANRRDLKAAARLPEALKDRLLLDEKRLRQMQDGIAEVAALPDPVGETGEFSVRPSGIEVGKMRVPLGVILAIYESRPNVTSDIAVLALKSGNAAILRGGSEAQNSNAAIGKCLARALADGGLPEAAAQVVSDSRRELADALLACEEIDLALPRGGRGLIEAVAQKARMPVLKHLDGNCHVYVDAAADLAMAKTIALNSKTRRFGVCNAAESMLVHQAVAAAFLPKIAAAFKKCGVEMRGCKKTRALVPGCKAAAESDWGAEYLAPVISIKIAADAGEAIAHINRFGSGHTDSIVTDSVETGRRFLREVDSASVMLNASTAFADGGEYGLGAEVGISTGKFHARGPVGLAGLTCQKYIVIGNGEARA